MAEATISSQSINAANALASLGGSLDAENFDIIEDEFNKLLESGVTGIVLDLSNLEAVSSSGLGAMLNLAQILAERDGRLVLASVKPKLEGLLEMLGIKERFTIADSIERAKQAVLS